MVGYLEMVYFELGGSVWVFIEQVLNLKMTVITTVLIF